MFVIWGSLASTLILLFPRTLFPRDAMKVIIRRTTEWTDRERTMTTWTDGQRTDDDDDGLGRRDGRTDRGRRRRQRNTTGLMD